ncbi:hypothetical protein E1B28_006176 [Marasmius oreades]|uniref:CNH domain-containing protein n=1 Tax=Marasmius oreades TaxID=181124 RepID=A0A9P7S4Y7_9AGAR|nr:uncharacterized protein E1B28_006176 [Marasmius oreades]KAG7095427.1 hypothetical protein E1B28_006176 [Marasmius oreades]
MSLRAPEVPPFQLQQLIPDAFAGLPLQSVEIRCAQAHGTEIYLGCSNGELMRFALQADDPNKMESYTILSRQSLPNDKPIDEIVLLPSISRALVLSDSQIHFYTLPSLDVVAYNIIKPIRHVLTFAVDHQHIMRPAQPPSGPMTRIEAVEFSVIKRNSIHLYSLREKLLFLKEIPLPQAARTLARRSGQYLCFADKEAYNVVDLETLQMLPILPLCQAEPIVDVQPFITVTGSGEFLLISWTGTSALGIFINGNGEPVRGTLEWPAHPKSVCFDYPYITTLLPNTTIEIHKVDTQEIVQVVSAPADGSPGRNILVASAAGYLVPSTQRSAKMRPVRVPLSVKS